MKKIAWLIAAVLAVSASTARAAGFGTPIVDGVVDAVYGAPEGIDPSDDPQGNAPMDLLDLYVCNDNDFWYFCYTIDANIVTTTWGKYLLYIDTTGDAAGATFDAWGRNVVVGDPTHRPEFSLNGWVDGGGAYGPSKTQLWSWNGVSWTSAGTAADAALVGGVLSTIEWKIARTTLGNPATLWCEVYSTGGGGGDNAQDTINDPADDWNATNWITQAVLSNSTRVARAAGSDTTPPILSSAVTIGQEPITQLQLTFSEAVTAATAEVEANYSVTGKTVTLAVLQADPSQVILTLNSALAYGTNYTVEATGIKDVAGNTIVDNNTTNRDCFKVFDLLFQANMNIFLRTGSTPPDTVAIEGSTSPLTWDPLCDNRLSDVDADSVYTGRLQFTIGTDCSTGLIPVGSSIEYKFTHQCSQYETSSNHFYGFDDAVGRDTLNIWWNNEAPADFSTRAVKVIFRASMNELVTPPTASDTVSVAGSQLPLTWDIPTGNMKDNGVAPDLTAGDGIYSGQVIFPTGTYKFPQYKYAINRDYECAGFGNRNLAIDDVLYNDTTSPQIVGLEYYDNCIAPAAIPDLAGIPAGLRLDVTPNPFTQSAEIRFVLPEAATATVAIYSAEGRRLRTLASGSFTAGVQTAHFDGRDDAGVALPPGVYFARVAAGSRSTGRTLTILP